MGFPVMNRPHAVTQLLAKLPPQITEEYVLIAETDHVFLSAPPNRATPQSPACFPFGYMNAKAAELRPILMEDFVAAQQTLRVSTALDTPTRESMMRWHDRFGEGGANRPPTKVGF